VFARERLRELGAPLPWERVHVLAPPVRAAGAAMPAAAATTEGRLGGAAMPAAAGATEGPLGGAAGPFDAAAQASGAAGQGGSYALVVSRLAPEKGLDVAIDACRLAGIPLVMAGEGPELGALRERARGSQARFTGRVEDAQLARLRAGAAIALAPSRSAETFGLAVAEAMAAGLPVVASRVGALPELVEEQGLVPPGDAGALAEAIGRRAGDRGAGERGLRRVRELCAPEIVAGRLARLYDGHDGAPAST
jgi:glycosyltransferase involved in cell wall biosynthesis